MMQIQTKYVKRTEEGTEIQGSKPSTEQTRQKELDRHGYGKSTTEKSNYGKQRCNNKHYQATVIAKKTMKQEIRL